ncbi:MAG: peptidylprolyl isomerase [Calditrichaceae bacterium]|nr:peptidylprolyl isomerase [Calditrichaceae bacterium]
MKVKITIKLSVVFFALNFSISCTVHDDNLVEMNRAEITSNEFAERYSGFAQASGIKDTRISRLEMINNLIAEKILLEIQDNSHITADPDFIVKSNQIKQEVLLAFYKEKEIFNKINITDLDLRQAFLRINEKVSARHLFAQTEEEAWKLYDLLANGMTFEQLAPHVFSDDSLANNGGYLGYFSWGDMDSKFEEAAFNLAIGEISKPIRTNYGYSIIKVEDRFKNPVLTEYQYQLKKNKLRRIVYIQKADQAEKNFINQLYKDINLQINGKNFNTLYRTILTTPVLLTSNQQENLTMNIGDETLVVSQLGEWTISKVMDKLTTTPASIRSKIQNDKLLKTAIKGLVLQEYLLQDARQKKYDQKEQVVNLTDKWINTKLFEWKIKDIISHSPVDTGQMHEYYLKNENEFYTETQYKIQEILVDSKMKAALIKQKIKDGYSFDSLAKEYSIRPNVDKTSGITNYLPKSQFGSLKDRIQDAEINKIYGPYEISGYFVYFKVLDYKAGEKLKYSDVKSGIKSFLQEINQRENFNNYLDKLKLDYKVKIDTTKLFSLKI